MSANIGNDINFAAKCIREGKLVAIPTETVYGLGADAFNPIAIAKVFEVKKRPSFDPLIVHIANIETLDMLFDAPIDNKVYLLAEAFWPGPLTIVYKKKPEVPDIVSSGLSTVAVRMPSHPIAQDLIRLSGTAIAAPSANLFGHLSPTKAQHVAKQLKGIDYILDGGKTHFGIESTVIALNQEEATILRPGAISLEDIRKVLPEATLIQTSKESHPDAPGMLKSHYSPRKPLYIIDTEKPSLPENSGLLLVSERNLCNQQTKVIRYLSKDGNLLEVAANLFAALHEMEENDEVKTIFIQSVEETGIGTAIMDRIRKAAYQYQNKNC
jgi:L-threonylcarbamoyladenylate synthase